MLNEILANAPVANGNDETSVDNEDSFNDGNVPLTQCVAEVEMQPMNEMDGINDTNNSSTVLHWV